MSTFEIINSPKDIEIVTTNKNITVRNLIEEFFKTSEFNADEIKYLKEILNEN
jgi:predicted transcriptional regulator